MQSRPPSCFGLDSARVAEAHLAVEFAGGRTTLRRQHVGYPLHVTRGFYLDSARPDLLTLYMQSASGGLYAGDQLKLDVVVGARTALHLTTQAATVVHDGRERTSAQQLRISVDAGAFCAVGSDPYILFPGANLSVDTIAVVAEDSVLFLADGIAVHDPRRSGRSFSRYFSRQRILRPDGRLLLHDCGRIAGDELRNGPFGTMAASATALIIAPSGKLPAVGSLIKAVDESGCLAGASEAPNRVGLVMRMLAPDGGALARGLEAGFHVVASAALGVTLARRRK
jgi:urease accessory protein